MNTMQDFLNQQAYEFICGRHGHNDVFVMPIVKKDESKEVQATCKTCRRKIWLRLPESGYTKLLKDLGSGKIY